MVQPGGPPTPVAIAEQHVGMAEAIRDLLRRLRETVAAEAAQDLSDGESGGMYELRAGPHLRLLRDHKAKISRGIGGMRELHVGQRLKCWRWSP